MELRKVSGGRRMIKQIIDESKTIQTGLAVEVEGIRIDYKQLDDRFGYAFLVVISSEDKETAIKEADAAIDMVISTLCAQSYDHGQEWRLVKKEVDTALLDMYGVYRVTASFRIKDFALCVERR